MAFSQRQIVTALSIIYLLGLIVMSSISLHKIRTLSLPIPTTLGAFTLVLPIVAGLTLELRVKSAGRTRQRGRQQTLRRWYPLMLFILVVYETVIATLSGTYIAPDGALDCGLQERWRNLWRLHNADAIRSIQDAFQCCGLRTSVDMPWPFPNKNTDVHECARRLGTDKSCFEDWKRDERLVAGLMLAVACLVFIWKALIVSRLSSGESWLNDSPRIQEIHDDDDEDPAAGDRRAIGYPEGYRDTPRLVDGTEAPTDRMETEGNHDAQNVLRTERHDDHEQWAAERRV